MTGLSSGQLRALIFGRDRGVCALCGWDTYAFQGLLAAQDVRLRLQYDQWTAPEQMAKARRAILSALGIPFDRQEFWDADHKVPRILGGEDARDNLQTLCILCHRHKTATAAPTTAKLLRLNRKRPGGR